MTNTQVAKAPETKGEITYQVAGEDIKLSPSIVHQFIARGSKELTNSEIGNFIQLCRYRKLNPFLNEAYPIKFGSEPAQLIVGADAFKRKAEENPNFAGYRAGVIVLRDKKVEELEGSFKLDTDVIVGGWCEVHIKGREFPVVAKVSFKEYNKGKSTWLQIPCTMIRKVALVQALREAFPSDLGAMYSSEEVGVDESNIQAQKPIQDIKQDIKNEVQEESKNEVIDIEVEEIKNVEIVEEPIEKEVDEGDF